MARHQDYRTLAATVAGLARAVAESADRLLAKARQLPPTTAAPDVLTLQTAFQLLARSTEALQGECERLTQTPGADNHLEPGPAPDSTGSPT